MRTKVKKILITIGGHIRDKHMYYVCALITLGLLALGIFRFPNAIGRIVEACRDLATSIVYAFCDLFEIETNISPTINNAPDYAYLHLGDLFKQLFGITPEPPTVPDVPIIPDVPTPAPPIEPPAPDVPLPSKWEVFQENWALYWSAFINEKNLLLYMWYVLLYLTWAIQIIMWVLPVVLGVKMYFKKVYFAEKRQKRKKKALYQDRIEESLPLRIWNFVYYHTFHPIGKWCLSLYCFIKERTELWQIWLLLVFLYFNVLTIVIEFFAYYVYFSVAVDFATLYQQVYKFALDMKPFISSLSMVGWVVFAVLLLRRKEENMELRGDL